MADKAMSRGAKLLQNLKLFRPWKITGPSSSAEFLEPLAPSTEYRVHAPVSQPVRPVVPHAEPDRIYDIKYYTRDSRRNMELVNKKTLAHYEMDVLAKDEALEALDLPPTPGKPYKWSKRRNLLDYDNNGYT